jgi:hypothetical protein
MPCLINVWLVPVQRMFLEFDTFLARLSLSIYPALGLIGAKCWLFDMLGPIFL